MGLIYCIGLILRVNISPWGLIQKVRGRRSYKKGEGIGWWYRDLLVRATKERPLYVVAVIYDRYRSQLRLMAFTLVFRAILLLAVAAPPRVGSSRPCLRFLYAKQEVMLVWFTLQFISLIVVQLHEIRKGRCQDFLFLYTCEKREKWKYSDWPLFKFLKELHIFEDVLPVFHTEKMNKQ